MPRDYETDRSIDPDALDVEWMEQPNLVYYYGKEKTSFKKVMDEAHERVKVIRSQLIKEKKENDPKVTGPVLEAYYRDHSEHKQAKQEFIDAEYDYNLSVVASEVITFQKKAALEAAVKLIYANYFSTPSDPRNLAEEMEAKKQKMARQRAKQSRQRRPSK